MTKIKKGSIVVQRRVYGRPPADTFKRTVCFNDWTSNIAGLLCIVGPQVPCISWKFTVLTTREIAIAELRVGAVSLPYVAKSGMLRDA